MTINVKDTNKEWMIGEMVLGNVTEYTHLGETITYDLIWKQLQKASTADINYSQR